jgi:hypothetical protein
MEATKILSTLYEVRKFVNPVIEKDLNTLILDLEAEAKGKTQTVDGRKQLSALRKFGKQCVKEMQNRETLAGAFKRPLEGADRWCLCDGFTAVVFNDVDGIPVTKFPNDTFEIDKIILPAKYKGEPFRLPLYSEVKAAYDLAKSAFVGKSGTFSHLTKLENGATLDTRKLLLFIEMLGIDGAEARQDGRCAPVYAAGTNGFEGVVLPVRTKDDND